MATRSAPPNRARTALLIVLGAVVLLAAVYAVAAFFASRQMPSEASVAGVDISGQSEEDAVATLERELAPRAEEEFRLQADGMEAAVVPADAGLAFDPQATIAGITDFTLDPRVVVEKLFGDRVYDPAIVIDEDAFTPVARTVAEDFTVDPVDAELGFEDEEIVLSEGESGTVVTEDMIRTTVEEQWLRTADALAVPAEETEPDITTAEAQAAETEIARPALSGDVVVSAAEEDEEGQPVGDASELVVSPEIIAGTLSFEPHESELRPVLDAEKLRTEVLDANPEVGSEAKDASFEIVDGKPRVVPGESGISVDETELAEAVLPALTADDRTASVALKEAEPEFTTEEAEKAEVDEVISAFSTRYSSEPNRDTNLRVASEKVSGTVVQPGEQFSLNEALGPRTAGNGYRPAGVISGGQMKEDYGGGVSQVSTTLFNAAYFAGFQLDEHQAHSRYISRYPEGRETTLDYSSIDLRFTNDSDTPVVLDMYLAGGEVHARVFGVKTVDVESSSSGRFAFTSPSTITESGPRCTPQSPREGWSITISRTITDHDSGAVVKRDEFTTVYRPVNKVVCE
ncbi:VanW family protein [Brevibacterium ihuae]|uniref:VanW family protein n=1 Tax=Brevibacterium ihuae TaxID=1631743 RepID=UPI000C75F8F5|nr:VanW family protein [Brevibacterium ihuae]